MTENVGPDRPPSRAPLTLPGGFGLDTALADVAAVRRGNGIPLALAAAIFAAAVLATGIPHASLLGGGVARTIPAIDTVLGAAIAALLVISPWEGLLAWIVVMPLLNMGQAQANLGPVQLIYPTAFLAAFLAGWLRRLVLERQDPEAARPTGLPRSARIAWVLAALVILLGAASVFVWKDSGGISIVLHGLVEPALLAATIVSMRPLRRELVWLVVSIGLSAAFASVLVMIRVGRIAPSLAQVEALRTDIARFTYYNVGIFGDVLAIALPLLVGAILLRRDLGLSRIAAAVLAVGTAVALVALYTTHSKSAWVGAGVAVLIVVLLGLRSLRLRAGVVALAIVASAIVIPWPQVALNAVGIDASAYTHLVERFQGGRISSWDPNTSEGEVSITERVLATEAAFRMAERYPLLGVGPGRFAIEYEDHFRKANATRGLTSAHDFLPNVAAELGVPMALLLTGILLAAAASLVASYRRRSAPAASGREAAVNRAAAAANDAAAAANDAAAAANDTAPTVTGTVPAASDTMPNSAPAEVPGAAVSRALAALLLSALVGFLIVATTFGVDLYRTYRVMNSDVLLVAILLAAAASLFVTTRESPAAV